MSKPFDPVLHRPDQSQHRAAPAWEPIFVGIILSPVFLCTLIYILALLAE